MDREPRHLVYLTISRLYIPAHLSHRQAASLSSDGGGLFHKTGAPGGLSRTLGAYVRTCARARVCVCPCVTGVCTHRRHSVRTDQLFAIGRSGRRTTRTPRQVAVPRLELVSVHKARPEMTTEADCSVLRCGEANRNPTKGIAVPTGKRNGPTEGGDPDRTKFDILESCFSYRVPGQHYYNGVLWSCIAPRRRLLDLEAFQVKADDVIVTGYPKSGTTWLEEIVYLIEHDVDLEKSNSVPVYMRVPYLESELGAMINDMESPRVYKTHLPYSMLPKQVHANQTRIVHITRDPHDIAVSYYHFYRSVAPLGRYTGTWDEFLNMFMAGYVCCGDWFEYIKGWRLHENDVNVFFVKYEEMIEDLRSSVLKIAKFLGRSLRDEQVDAIVKHTNFNSMKENPSLNLDGVPDIDSSISPFMRKGEVGDWMNYFSTTQLEAFDKVMAKKLGPGMCLN